MARVEEKQPCSVAQMPVRGAQVGGTRSREVDHRPISVVRGSDAPDRATWGEILGSKELKRDTRFERAGVSRPLVEFLSELGSGLSEQSSRQSSSDQQGSEMGIYAF